MTKLTKNLYFQCQTWNCICFCKLHKWAHMMKTNLLPNFTLYTLNSSPLFYTAFVKSNHSGINIIYFVIPVKYQVTYLYHLRVRTKIKFHTDLSVQVIFLQCNALGLSTLLRMDSFRSCHPWAGGFGYYEKAG